MAQILRPKDAAAKVGLSLPQIHRLRREGLFPEPVQLTPFSVGYLESDLEDWIASRPRGTSTRPVPASPGRPKGRKRVPVLRGIRREDLPPSSAPGSSIADEEEATS